MIKKIGYLLAVFAIGAVLSLPFLIKVRVECKSQYGACPSEIGSAVGVYTGKSIFLSEKGIKKVLEGNLLISDFSIQFKLPDLLLVNTIIKKPFFALMDRSSGKYGLVDSSGRILSIADSSSLPTVVTDSSLELGKSIDPGNLFALKLMEGVYQMYQIGRGEIRDNSLVVELPPRFNVTFPLEGDTDVLLGELRLVYAKVQASENPSTYSQIDLRFKNPVLR